MSITCLLFDIKEEPYVGSRFLCEVILTTITLPANSSPRNIVFSPDGSRAYVTCADNDNIVVINTASNSILTTIFRPVGSHPSGIALVPDGSRAYMTTADSSVTVVDLTNNSFFTTLPA